MNILSVLAQPRYLWPRLFRKIKLAFHSEATQIFTLLDGSLFECLLKSNTALMLTLDSLEPAEQRFVYERLKAGDIFLDIGANRGLYTLLAAKRIGPAGHVYAFEPSVREIKALEKNLALNNITNVTIIPKALSAQSGALRFAIASDGGLNSLAQNAHPEQIIETWQTVAVTTLDEFIAEQGLQQIALIKIDVEGAEVSVLQGAAGLLNSVTPPPVMCEFCDLTAQGFQSSGRKLFDTFTAYGYKMHRIRLVGSAVSLERVQPAEHYDFENLVAIK